MNNTRWNLNQVKSEKRILKIIGITVIFTLGVMSLFTWKSEEIMTFALSTKIQMELETQEENMLTELNATVRDKFVCKGLMQKYIKSHFDQLHYFVENDILEPIFHGIPNNHSFTQMYGSQIISYGCKSSNVIWLSMKKTEYQRKMIESLQL